MVGHKYKKASGDGDVSGHPRPFGSDGSLDDLYRHHHSRAEDVGHIGSSDAFGDKVFAGRVLLVFRSILCGRRFLLFAFLLQVPHLFHN